HTLYTCYLPATLFPYTTLFRSTRETFKNEGRLTDLIESGKLFEDIGLPPFNPEDDRIMICGSPSMLKDLVEVSKSRGFVEGTSQDRKSTRLNSSHVSISYAVFC